jgi:hypothetical protein
MHHWPLALALSRSLSSSLALSLSRSPAKVQAAEEEGGDETELLETTAEISDNEISPINGTLGIASFDITAAFHNAPMPASNYTRTP